MRKQKTKRSMMGISLLAVMGITLLAPGAGMNEVNATSTPSDAGIEAVAATMPSDTEIEAVAATMPSDTEIEENEASAPSDLELMNAAPVEINSTAFPDDVFREWVKDNCDKNSDGYLSADEMLQCTDIAVIQKQITSLKGIELFPQLTKLQCSDNELSSLDVSKNTALMHLICYKNELSSLDVSKNTALLTLRCEFNNISSLDVSKNTALLTLECDANNISSLDVSKNTALTYLRCGNNQLSSLDVSNNAALTYLHCGNFFNLYTSYNKLSSLDVSDNTDLTSLYCQGNKIFQLDLSKNTKLAHLKHDQTVWIPMYKNGDEYYIDLSGLLSDFKRVSIDEASGEADGAAYDSTSGRIKLSDAKDVGDTVAYLYETNGPASLGNTNPKMTVTLKISEVRDITEPTTEEPTTEEPTAEQPTTEEPATAESVVIVPPTTQPEKAKDAAPKTGDTTPLYPIIFLMLVSFAGGMILYIRRKHTL